MRFEGHVARMGEKKIGKKTRKKVALRRPRCRGVNNIKMDLRKTEWTGLIWLYKMLGSS
jgi:hypothetical protein